MGSKVRKPKDQLKQEFVRVRVTSEHKKRLFRAATQSGLDLSSWLRSIGLREAAQILDERDAAQWFKRYNGKAPEKGGARKSMATRPKDWLEQTRKDWADHANQALARAGSRAWGSIYLGDTSILPLELVGANITMQSKGGQTWTTTVTAVLERSSEQVIVTNSGRPK